MMINNVNKESEGRTLSVQWNRLRFVTAKQPGYVSYSTQQPQNEMTVQAE